MNAAIAATLLAPWERCPPGLRAWNGSDPAQRLDVHRNNVVVSLVAALGETFPVVRELVGEEFFGAMAAVFVRSNPPRSRVLAHYGRGFTEFVAEFEPVEHLPFLADVAALEMARLEALHASDAEPLSPEAAHAALVAAQSSGDARIVLNPSLQVVGSRHAVVSIWAAHQGQGKLEDVDCGQPEAALVLRPALDVLVVPCDLATSRFVLALQRGCALAQAASIPGLDLAAAIAALLAHGAIVSIEPVMGEA
ncbi:MAG: putative DNA-binding domain-containing protein [Burkholderiales bacterium]|nr:putative DNA-binding domain-containing protein [Burkholderiales bacterium]